VLDDQQFTATVGSKNYVVSDTNTSQKGSRSSSTLAERAYTNNNLGGGGMLEEKSMALPKGPVTNRATPTCPPLQKGWVTTRVIAVKSANETDEKSFKTHRV
jgi:hypothetical protein